MVVSIDQHLYMVQTFKCLTSITYYSYGWVESHEAGETSKAALIIYLHPSVQLYE